MSFTMFDQEHPTPEEVIAAGLEEALWLTKRCYVGFGYGLLLETLTYAGKVGVTLTPEHHAAVNELAECVRDGWPSNHFANSDGNDYVSSFLEEFRENRRASPASPTM